MLGADPTNLSRELARLASLNILVSEREGKQKYFKVNKRSPFFAEMKGLILKTVGVVGAIKTVYGSFAKNQESPESDVDLMVIGNPNLDEIEDGISKIEHKLGRKVLADTTPVYYPSLRGHSPRSLSTAR